jgi:hypothetical protein
MFNPKIVGADRFAKGGALAASLVAAAGPARLYSVTVFNTNAAAQYIQVHDAAAVPANGAVPKLCMAVPGGGQGSFDFGDGRITATGIVVANSSTAATLTIGAADCLIDCTYRLKS